MFVQSVSAVRARPRFAVDPVFRQIDKNRNAGVSQLARTKLASSRAGADPQEAPDGIS
jgi:hypothetical protein